MAGKQSFSFDPSTDSHGPRLDSQETDRMARQWDALHKAGHAVAAIAGLPQYPPTSPIGDFPARISQAGSRRRQRAENGIADLARIMTLGLSTLAAIRHRGGDARMAARALWREYDAARRALLALAPPD